MFETAPPITERSSVRHRLRFSDWLLSAPFVGIHVAAVAGLFFVPVRVSYLLVAAAVYGVGMAFITMGYHRYFSHRSFKTSRVFQFLLAFGCMATAQKGVLWWAANHRHHHRYSDEEPDLHSPVQSGIWWSHIGWVLSNEYAPTRTELVRDLVKFPELRWLNRYHLVPPTVFGTVAYLAGGLPGFYWGFILPLVLLWHGSFTVNSLAHTWGWRRFPTRDTSRNNWVLALLTHGEGWHNNHHYYQASARQGFYWWEIDVSYYVLKGWQMLGLVWDVHTPPARVLAAASPSSTTSRR